MGTSGQQSGSVSKWWNDGKCIHETVEKVLKRHQVDTEKLSQREVTKTTVEQRMFTCVRT